MQIIKFKNIVITILIIPIISCNDISQNKSTGHENQLFSLNNETNEIFMSKSNIIDRTLKNTNQNAPLANLNIKEIFLNDNIDSLKEAINNGLDPRKITKYSGKLGITPLHVACENGSNQILRYLMDFNINPNIQDNGGRTLLHTAIIGDNVKTVKLLLKMGANVNIKNNQGYTPLDVYLINKENLNKSLNDMLLQSKAKRSIEL